MANPEKSPVPNEGQAVEQPRQAPRVVESPEDPTKRVFSGYAKAGHEAMALVEDVGESRSLDAETKVDLMRKAKGGMDEAFGKVMQAEAVGTYFDDIYFGELTSAVLFAFPEDQIDMVYETIAEVAREDLGEKYDAVKSLPDMGHPALLLAFIGRKAELGKDGRPADFDVVFDAARTKQALNLVAAKLESRGATTVAGKLRAVDLSHLDQLSRKFRG